MGVDMGQTYCGCGGWLSNLARHRIEASDASLGTIEKFSAESGYTPDALRSKIKRGDWLEGQVWIKAPDGGILIDTEG
jgi:hypothetical protein